jgi:hypothetical protein
MRIQRQEAAETRAKQLHVDLRASLSFGNITNDQGAQRDEKEDSLTLICAVMEEPGVEMGTSRRPYKKKIPIK